MMKELPWLPCSPGQDPAYPPPYREPGPRRWAWPRPPERRSEISHSSPPGTQSPRPAKVQMQNQGLLKHPNLIICSKPMHGHSI